MLRLKLLSVLWWIIQRYILGHPVLFARHVNRLKEKLSELPVALTYSGYWFSLLRIYRYVITPTVQPVSLLATPQVSVPAEPQKTFILSPVVGTFFHSRDETGRLIGYTGRTFNRGEVIGSMLVLRLTFPIELTRVWVGTESEIAQHKYREITDFAAVRIRRVLIRNHQIVEWGQLLFEVDLVETINQPVPW